MEEQTLKLAEDVFDNLFNDKKVTIRKGNRYIHPGELLFESVSGKRKIKVHVNMVYYVSLRNVFDVDLINGGFINHQDAEKEMKRFYPDITQDTMVTVIRFSM